MAFNLKNPNDVLLGTGILYVNGTDVGLLKGNVTFSYVPEYAEITGGSPEQLVSKRLISEKATLTAGMLEINPDTIGAIMPIFTKDTTSSGDVTVTKEYIGAVAPGTWTACDYPNWTEDGTVSVFLASPLAAAANSGVTKIYVEDASLFSQADSVVLIDGATTETMTIDTGGVSEAENSLTFTQATTKSFTIAGTAHNATVSLAEGTDFFVNRIEGGITILDGSSKINSGDTASVTYEYAAPSSQDLYAGGKMSTDDYPVRFEAERADGKTWVLSFSRAQLDGEFNMEFNPSDAMVLSVTISALADSTYTEGKQLFSLKLVAAS